MPTIGGSGPFRVFFYSADCGEPAHVHVERDGVVAKVWLHDLRIARSGGFPASELGRIIRLLRDKRTELKERRDEHCGS